MNSSLSGQSCENNSCAKICLRYLNYDSSWTPLGTSHEDPNQHPFLDYAVRSWALHINSSGSDYKDLIRLVNKLFTPHGSHWINWRDRYEKLVYQVSQQPESSQINHGGLLYYAALFGLVDTLKFLQDQKVDDWDSVGGQHGTALQAASAAGHLSAISFLIDHGADIDAHCGLHGCAINAAADSGNIKVILVLVNAGASLSIGDEAGRMPLYLAAMKGHIEVVKLLLDKGADISVANANGWTPLNNAASNGHLEVVKLLLDKGADYNAQAESYGNTLHVASHKGHVEIVEMLSNKAADFSYKDYQGRTALHLACAGGNLATIKFLSRDRLGLTITDNQGRSCLHHGASGGSASTTGWLLGQGLDPNLTDRDGWTSLHWAAKSGSVETLETLWNAGAISSSEYINRWTPQDVALFHHHGRLPVSTSSIQVGIASGCSVPEQVASHLAPKDAAKDQISPGTIQNNVRCDGCFLVSRLLKILILYITDRNRKYVVPGISAWSAPILIIASNAIFHQI